MDESTRSQRIAQLNDECRDSLGATGQLVVTQGIHELSVITRTALLAMIRDVQSFGEDAWNEHDFGEIEVDGYRCFWKIDYFDKECVYGSQDPADPDQTTRILTIMLASEY